MLKKEFDRFRTEKKSQKTIRINQYYFDGTRKILLEESMVLDESEQNAVIEELMDWNDAIIIQKKNTDGVILAEALVIKESKSEEIIIRANGSLWFDKVSIISSVINWFKNSADYPEKMKEPFFVNISFSSLSIFDLPTPL